jgi:hypothetical protein
MPAENRNSIAKQKKNYNVLVPLAVVFNPIIYLFV